MSALPCCCDIALQSGLSVGPGHSFCICLAWVLWDCPAACVISVDSGLSLAWEAPGPSCTLNRQRADPGTVMWFIPWLKCNFEWQRTVLVWVGAWEVYLAFYLLAYLLWEVKCLGMVVCSSFFCEWMVFCPFMFLPAHCIAYPATASTSDCRV